MGWVGFRTEITGVVGGMNPGGGGILMDLGNVEAVDATEEIALNIQSSKNK